MKLEAFGSYRSKPFVNMVDDRIRLVITCKNWEWHKLDRLIKESDDLRLEFSDNLKKELGT